MLPFMKPQRCKDSWDFLFQPLSGLTENAIRLAFLPASFSDGRFSGLDVFSLILLGEQ
jgi:hypothetical protein